MAKNYFEGVNLSFLNIIPGKTRILDYGCGEGALSIHCLRQGAIVVGVDIGLRASRNIIENITETEKKNFIYISLNNFINRTAYYFESFDYIFCREVLEHIENYYAIPPLFNKVLKINGHLVLSVPSEKTEKLFSFFDHQWLKKSEHLNIFSQKEILNLFQKSCFSIKKIENQGFKWFLFWFFLAPLKVEHVMGNPKSHPRIVNIHLKIVSRLMKIPFVEKVGNRFFGKSKFFYFKKRKPSFLLVYDYDYWILGKWAKQIKNLYSDKYDIFLISMFDENIDKKVQDVIDKIDFIHILLPHCYGMFHKFNKPIITTIHHWIEPKQYEDSIQGSKYIVTDSQEWTDKMIVRLNGDRDNIFQVHAAVDEKYFKSHLETLLFSNSITIGFFAKKDSNENDRKGTRHFINFVKIIADRGLGYKFRFVISGPGWNNFVKTIREQNIEVIYSEFTDDNDMPALYASLDIYLNLADVEGGPVTVIEAMASHCLVLSTSVGLAKDVIVDNVTGIIINNDLPEDILSSIEFIMDNNNLRNFILNNAYEYVKSNMRYEKTFKPLEKLYQKISNEACRQKVDSNV